MLDVRVQEMNFYYQKSARMRALQKLFFSVETFGAILMAFLLASLIETLINGDVGWHVLILGAPVLMLSLSFFSLFLSMITWIETAIMDGGKWEIKILDSEVIWNAPEFAEESFRLNFNDIRCFSKIQTGEGELYDISYSIESEDGKIIQLSSWSGIRLDMFMESLRDISEKHGLGMKYEHRKLP